MFRRSALSLVAAILATSTLSAQQLTQEPKPHELQKGEEGKPWALELSLDVPTAYFFRGYNVEDSGYILQPSATFRYTVYDQNDLSITPYITAWESIHEKKSPNNPKHWNESDLYGGVEFAWQKWSIDVVYNRYMYPGNIAGTTDEIGVTLAYDDSAWAEEVGLPVSLQPHVCWFREISDANGEQDQAWEAGIEPSFGIGDTKFEVTLPVTVGMSTDGFYTDRAGHNEFFGYVSAGVEVSHPLPVPESFGTWSVSAGVEYLHLIAPSVRDADNGDANAVYAKLGITAEF